MLVQSIQVSDATPASINEKLETVALHQVACVNWPTEFPSKPNVSFKIAHDGQNIYLEFFVEENEIMANTPADNGPVWSDSCVEFFIQFPGSTYYYNIETNCAGKVLFGYRPGRKGFVHASQDVLSKIKRYPSLGTVPFDKKEGDFKWNLLLVIPVSAFWESEITSFSGLSAKANFYKCGDYLSVPHYLSWNPISTAKPDFHQPPYFGDLEFE